MASKITLVNKNNSAQSLKFHLFGPAQNRINVANVLNGFKASAVFMEDDTLMEADDNVLSVDTFTTRSTYTVIIIPIHEDTRPPRLMYRVHENLGYANFTIQHQNVTTQEDMLIDRGCGLEVLFTEAYVGRLQLKEVAGYDIVVVVVGDTRQQDDSNVVDMDIGAILDVSAPSDSHGPVLAIGSIGCILGRPGLLRLGLEVHVSKEYLYPTTIVSAFVFPVMVL
ncbi:unnamed protein product [Sphagnum jensenii]|uniref:Uncharacterized protein n=1 Tax=Sphagnum jensenii TaxID=128206 RepID=A0ABP0W396_9BRYO